MTGTDQYFLISVWVYFSISLFPMVRVVRHGYSCKHPCLCQDDNLEDDVSEHSVVMSPEYGFLDESRGRRTESADSSDSEMRLGLEVEHVHVNTLVNGTKKEKHEKKLYS